MHKRARMGIYMLAGVYLLGLAYNMFINWSNSTGWELLLVACGIILFALTGAGMLSAGIYSMWKQRKEKDNEDAG